MPQKLYKIKANTLQEAYERMRKKFGDDAIILNTRQVIEGGLFGIFGRKIVELTVSATTPGPPMQRQQSPVERKYAEHSSGAPVGGTSAPSPAPDNLKHLEQLVRDAQRRMNAQPVPTATPKTGPSTYTRTAQPAASAGPSLANPGHAQGAAQANTAPMLAFPQRKAEPDDAIHKELSEIRTMLQVLYSENPGAGLPTEFAPHYRQLIQQGVSRRIAAELTAAVLKDSDPQILRDPRVFNERLMIEIRKRIQTIPPITAQPGQNKRIALCGSTGVGKTTNLAKLAANLAVREQASIGLITTDTYRVAAIDQLRVYANIIGLPLRIAHDPQEATSALKEFQHHQITLIDTAGGSQFNLQQINELKTMLTSIQPHQVYLVLSAATPLEDLRNAINNFQCLHPTALIFTKLDETRQYGALLTATIESQLPLAYLSTGQNVPEDIQPATPGAVATLLVEGRANRV